MNKKTITLLLIALLILNTFFWFHLIVLGTPRTYFQLPPLLGGKASGKIVERSYMERLSIALGEWESSKVAITFLLITDAVLIAISFMIIFYIRIFEKLIFYKSNK